MTRVFRSLSVAFLVGLLGLPAIAQVPTSDDELVATFSIVAYDKDKQEWGVAVESKYFCVACAVPWAEAGVGAVATQAFVNIDFGPKALALLKAGFSAEEALKILIGNDDQADRRQLAIVDAKGNIAAHTGGKALTWAGHKKGANYTVQGNILVSEEVVNAMARAFEQTKGELADKLMAALEAGQAAGGDSRGQQSAALLVVRAAAGPGGTDRYLDLRVDDHDQPIAELRRILSLHQGYAALRRSGQAWFREKNAQEALREARRAVALMPNEDVAYSALGTALYFAGEREAAKDTFRTALRLNPRLRPLIATMAERNPEIDPKFVEEVLKEEQ
jgi:uncharacterized Ntn-hydrolase superfamily protein